MNNLFICSKEAFKGALFFIAWLCLFILIALGLRQANAEEYKAADLSKYYESLMQPDNPTASCCGHGDGYQANIVEPCTIFSGPNCALIAVITDRGPNNFFVNGKPITRKPVPVGTKIIVPFNKIRKKPVPNPTDNNIIFLNSYKDVLCWEPLGGL